MLFATKFLFLLILMLFVLYYCNSINTTRMDLERNVKLKTGMLMPRVGLGTARNFGDILRKAIDTALECGYRSVDTAFSYKNEQTIGDALKNWFTQGKLKREEVFVISKLPPIANHPEDVGAFLNKSLENLQLDYLDLYLIHSPIGRKFRSLENGSDMGDHTLLARIPNVVSVLDLDTDLEAVWKAMEEQVAAGKAKAIGVSNFNISQIDRIVKVAKVPVAANEVEVHLYLQQTSLLEKCKERGIPVIAYSPLGAPHRHRKAFSTPPLENPKVIEIGKKYGKTGAQVLLRLLLQLDVAVIPKSSHPERIKSNIDIYDFVLSDSEIQTLKQLDRGEKGRVNLGHKYRDYQAQRIFIS